VAGVSGERDPVGGPGALRIGVAAGARLDGDPTLRVAADGPGGSGGLLVDGVPIAARLDRLDDGHARLEIVDGDQVVRTDVLLGPLRPRSAPGGAGGDRGVLVREVVVDGWRLEIEIEPERRAALRERARRAGSVAAPGGPVEIRAIIPGRVVAVSVAAGDPVEAGRQMLVVEAMKMQNELRAPREGTVERVGVAVGDTIEVGDLLAVIR